VKNRNETCKKDSFSKKSGLQVSFQKCCSCVCDGLFYRCKRVSFTGLVSVCEGLFYRCKRVSFTGVNRSLLQVLFLYVKCKAPHCCVCIYAHTSLFHRSLVCIYILIHLICLYITLVCVYTHIFCVYVYIHITLVCIYMHAHHSFEYVCIHITRL